ncbi:hypothetical protein B0H63DRAFT_388880 [Podospora didyma]|uniref:C2H2-type domain-containing protein n=1 Tax=Podospora didyma TaxID=330526 RepID=A0AAE0NZN9_9PEZI|nr:hypothetical protein B0H63DRAFT_388880 [Podospora didyma]
MPRSKKEAEKSPQEAFGYDAPIQHSSRYSTFHEILTTQDTGFEQDFANPATRDSVLADFNFDSFLHESESGQGHDFGQVAGSSHGQGIQGHGQQEEPATSTTEESKTKEHRDSAKRGAARPRKSTLNQGRDEEQDDSDHDGRRKKAKRAPAGKETVVGDADKKFACPYFKRNRRKYCKWTSCPGPGWDEVHRVKTHLYRRHALPIQCPRCWDVFKGDNQLRAHLQQDPPCDVRTNQTLVEGFTKDQEKRLRSRKKVQADMTDEDKWREIYMILFPDDDKATIPSPYYDQTDYDLDESSSSGTGELEDYATFIRREMPTLVRRELESVFQDESQDVEERLRPRMAEILLNLQPKLLRLYKQSQSPLSGYGPQDNDVVVGSGSGSDQVWTPSLSQDTGTGTDSTPPTGNNTDREDSLPLGGTAFGFNVNDLLDFDLSGAGSGFEWSEAVLNNAPVDAMQFQAAYDLNVGAGSNYNNWDYDIEKLASPDAMYTPNHTGGSGGDVTGTYTQTTTT